MGKRLNRLREITTSDVSGARVSVPPGTYYRGLVMSKHEAIERRRRDYSEEVTSPRMAEIEQQLEEALDVEQED